MKEENVFFNTLKRIEHVEHFLSSMDSMDSVLSKIEKIERSLKRYESLDVLLEHLSRLEKNAFYVKPRLTIEESAIYLGVSKSYIYKLTAAHQLTLTKPEGKMTYIARDELDKWMSRNELPSDDKINRLACLKTEELRHSINKGAATFL